MTSTQHGLMSHSRRLHHIVSLQFSFLPQLFGTLRSVVIQSLKLLLLMSVRIILHRHFVAAREPKSVHVTRAQ